MTLTKEDLAAIGILISENNAVLESRFDAKLEEKLAPIREAVQGLMKTVVKIVAEIGVMRQDMTDVKLDVKFLKSHILLQDDISDLRMRIAKDLD